MSAKWGRTRAAINTGYGYSPVLRSLSAPTRLTSKVSTNRTRGGKTLTKRQRELRARKLLQGGFALPGGGEFLKSFLLSLSGTAKNALKQLMLETGASITELLSDPKRLLLMLKNIAPKVVNVFARIFGLKKWFNKHKDDDIDDTSMNDKPSKKQELNSDVIMQWIQSKYPKLFTVIEKSTPKQVQEIMRLINQEQQQQQYQQQQQQQQPQPKSRELPPRYA